MFFRPLVLLLSLFLFAAVGCSGSDDEPADNNSVVADPLNGLNPVVNSTAYVQTSAGPASVSELLTYRMPAVNGGVVEAKAVVLIPGGPPPAGGFPVVAWGHGTTGVADRCAPSATGNLRGSIGNINQYIENGYAVVAPDYEGLGSAGPHPYLHLASEGRSLIYAVKAAVQQYSQLSNRYAAVGHSQGGHAVLGAAEYAAELEDIVLAGVAAIAPAANIREQGDVLSSIITDQSRSAAERVRAGIQQVLFSGLILNSVEVVNSSFDSESAYGGNGGPLLASIDTDCTDEISSSLLGVVTASIAISSGVDSIISSASADIPAVSQYLIANEPGTSTITVPVLLLQGALDETVLPFSTRQLHNALQLNNTDSTLDVYPTATHGSIVGLSLGAVLNFLGGLF